MHLLHDKLKELLIVGVPRSGSTLLGALVDSLENAVCLSEPDELFISPDETDKEGYLNSIITALDSYREKVRAHEIIVDKRNPDGTPTTNYIQNTATQERFLKPERGNIDTSKYSAENMLVAIKHNVPFLAVLPDLSAMQIPVVGVVRHPVPTILSWQETNLPVGQGWMPSAQAFWPALNRIMENSATRVEGWVRIYDAFCQRLVEAAIPIVMYETVIQDASVLERYVGRRSVRKVAVTHKDWREYEGFHTQLEIRSALAAHGRFATKLYPDCTVSLEPGFVTPG